MSKIQVFKHSSIRIETKEGILYVDPYQMEEEKHDADYLFITHSHYDHFSKEDMEKVKKEGSKIITVESSAKEAEEIVRKTKCKGCSSK